MHLYRIKSAALYCYRKHYLACEGAGNTAHVWMEGLYTSWLPYLMTNDFVVIYTYFNIL